MPQIKNEVMKMKFPIALQLYSIRDVMEKDFEDGLRQVKKYGYDGVEFAGMHGNKPAEIKKLLQDIGLTALSAHVPYAEFVEDAEKVASDYAEIGCKYVAIPYLIDEDRPGTTKFQEVISNIARFGEILNKYNVTLLYHNHDFEFVKVDGEYGLDLLYRKVPADLLQTEIDTCWVNVAGENPSEYILKYSGRAPVVHLKDFYLPGKKPENMYELVGIDDEKDDNSREGFEFRPVGKGMQDIPSILDASEKAGAEWVVVEQDLPSMGMSSLESVKSSIDYLRTL